MIFNFFQVYTSQATLEYSDAELNEVVAKIPEEMIVEVGESLCDFYTKYGLAKRFNSWAINREVENTSTKNMFYVKN